MSDAPPSSHKKWLLHLLAINLISAALLSPLIFHADFVYDDGAVITRNPFPHSTANLKYLFSPEYYRHAGEKTYRPLVTLTYFIDDALYGLHPAGYHATSILLHVIAGFLLGLVARRLLRSPTAALFAAAVFAVHPVMLEAIACAGYREDILVTVFCLGALHLALSRSARGTPAKRIVPWLIVFLTGAFLSKETAVVIPALLLLTAWWFPSNLPRKAVWPLITVSVTLAVFFLLLWFRIMPPPVSYAPDAPSITDRLASLPGIFAFYIRLILFPVGLSVEHPLPPSGPASWVADLIFIAVWWLSYRRRSPVFFGLTWFIIALAPVLNVYPPLLNPVAERYLYFPFCGAALAAGAVYSIANRRAATLKPRPKLLIPAFLVLYFVIFPAVMRQRLLPVWRNNLTLWRHAIRIAPESARAYMNYALALARIAHDGDGAWRAFQRAHELDPDSVLVIYNMGLHQHRTGHPDEAERYYRRALELDPDHPGVLSEYGKLLCTEHRFGEARKLFLKGRQAWPDDPRFPRLLQSVAPYLPAGTSHPNTTAR